MLAYYLTLMILNSVAFGKLFLNCMNVTELIVIALLFLIVLGVTMAPIGQPSLSFLRNFRLNGLLIGLRSFIAYRKLVKFNRV